MPCLPRAPIPSDLGSSRSSRPQVKPGCGPGRGSGLATRPHRIGGNAALEGTGIGLAGTLALRPALALLTVAALTLHALALSALTLTALALTALALHALALAAFAALALHALALTALALHPLALAAFSTLALHALALATLALHALALAAFSALALHALALTALAALTLHALALAALTLAALALHPLAVATRTSFAARAPVPEAVAARPAEARAGAAEAGTAEAAAARVGREGMQAVPALAAQQLQAALAAQLGPDEHATHDAAHHGTQGGIAGIAVLGEALARCGEHRRECGDRNDDALHAEFPRKSDVGLSFPNRRAALWLPHPAPQVNGFAAWRPREHRLCLRLARHCQSGSSRRVTFRPSMARKSPAASRRPASAPDRSARSFQLSRKIIMPAIALVDDDRNILTSVSLTLEAEGYRVQTYTDGAAALDGLKTNPPDLAIFDIKMPRMDGMELLRRLRQKSDLPVIFLTSKDEEIDELFGLKMGADDFIRKPFSQRLLVERVKAILRRANPKEAAAQKESEAKLLERGNLKMDPERHTCTWKNEQVVLTVTEFLILQALATRPGVVKSRNALMDAAYDDQVYVDDRTIDSHIKRLRKKFKVVDDDFEMIETLYGVGYRFKEA